MSLEVQVVADAAALARHGARALHERIVSARDEGRVLRVALSGGRTPWLMLDALLALSPPWSAVEIWQVDERVAPDADAARNLTHLRAHLPPEAVVHPMPVDSDASEPEVADLAARYATGLPDVFDLVHLGLGADGHTASLVPGDPVLDVTDRRVAVTRTYQKHRRMTLTFPVLDAAREVLWLVSGSDKRDAVRRLRSGDRTIPAARVAASRQLLLLDAAAVSD